MRRTLAFLVVITVALATGSCRHTSEGPAERAGKKVDNAAQDTKDALKDTKKDVKRDLDK